MTRPLEAKVANRLCAGDPSALRVSKDRATLRERTVDRLREGILNQYFAPGDRLIERELCELTGVSRTSIREALRELESEGLIETIPHRGPIVASLSLEDARHIYEVREALEGLAARLFVERATDDEVEALDEAGQSMGRAIGERDVPAVLEAIDDFYDTLFEGCGNPAAASMIRSLRTRMHFLRTTTTLGQSDRRSRESIENFQKIVAAVKQRDARKAADACLAQVRHAALVAGEVLGEQAAASR